MKKEYIWILAVVAALAALYLGWPHVRGGYARAKSLFTKRQFVVDGTAHKGNDSGGVLTSADNC